MRRGEVWTASGGKDYAGKPRPVVILQDDSFDETQSVVVCAFTTNPTDAPSFRLLVAPSERNGLRIASRLMIDKVTSVPRSKLGERLGSLEPEDMRRLNRAVFLFLGLATSARGPSVVES